MPTTRINLRLDAEIKAKAKKAAALLGISSLTEYVVHLINQDANQVLDQYHQLSLTNHEFDHFMQTCKQSQGPNQALKDAAAFTQQQGFD